MKKTYATQYEKMTEKPVLPLLIGLSIPTIISMLISNIYNLVDTAFVGQLGTSASGAVGIVFGFMSILQAFAFMFGQGCGSMMSRKLGAQDKAQASVIVSTGFYSSLFFGLILGVASFLELDPLVLLLGATDTIAPYAKTYITFIILAAPGLTASFTMNNILRYEGRAFLGMCGMITGAILNIVLDPILMFVCGLGIAGAGLSTCISQYVSFFILRYMFWSGRTQTKLSLKLADFHPAMVGEIMSTGFPSLLRNGLNSLATVLLNSESAVYGDAAVAAMSIVTRIVFFVFSVAVGIGQGFQPISGFNYGAGKYKRLREAFTKTAVLAECLMLVLCVLTYIFGEPILHIFRDDPEVVSIALRPLHLQLISQCVLPPCMVVEMLMQSTGHKVSASFLSASRSGLFFIPALLILANTRGLMGIQEAQPVASTLAVIPTIIVAILFFKKLPKEDTVNGTV